MTQPAAVLAAISRSLLDTADPANPDADAIQYAATLMLVRACQAARPAAHSITHRSVIRWLDPFVADLQALAATTPDLDFAGALEEIIAGLRRDYTAGVDFRVQLWDTRGRQFVAIVRAPDPYQAERRAHANDVSYFVSDPLPEDVEFIDTVEITDYPAMRAVRLRRACRALR